MNGEMKAATPSRLAAVKMTISATRSGLEREPKSLVLVSTLNVLILDGVFGPLSSSVLGLREGVARSKKHVSFFNSPRLCRRFIPSQTCYGIAVSACQLKQYLR